MNTCRAARLRLASAAALRSTADITDASGAKAEEKG